MTLSFLAPWAFAFSALLAVPLAVHIFKPRRVRRTPFSSLRWLKLSPQKLSRRLQWHQVLLFALRAAFVLLLVAALARPVLAPAGAARPVDRFVVLDVSRSMALKPDGRPTPLERAKEIAAGLVRRHGPGDRTSVLLTAAATATLAPLTRDPEPYLAALAAVAPTAADTDLASALAAVRPQLGRRDADAEVVFFTDNPAGGWRPATVADFAKGLPATAKVTVVDVGAAGASNAWVARATVSETGSPPRRVVRADLACAGDAGQTRTLRLTGLAGAGDQTQAVTLDPGKPGWVEFTLPPGLDPAGQVARLRLEPADALPDDDEFLLPLDAPAALRVLVVEADSSASASQRPGFALATALDVLAADRLPATVLRRTHREVTPRDFDAADVAILADPADLPAACVEAAARRTKEGGGLAVFLGPNGTPAFWDKLADPLRPAEGLLAAAPQPPAAGDRPALLPLTDVRANHPLFAGLTDPVLGDLALVRFKAAARLSPADEVVARVDGGDPAVIDRPLGAGRVVAFAAGADDSWCDLPRRRCFLPLADRLVAHLAAAGVRRDFTAGRPLAVALPDWKPGERVTVTAPGGRELTPEVRPLPGGRVLLRLASADEPGVYTVERAGGKLPLAVNSGRGDSPLTPADPEALRPWWGGVAFERVAADDFAAGAAAPADRRAVWPWLAALAALVLATETYLANRLCPRANPTLARPLVSRTPAA